MRLIHAAAASFLLASGFAGTIPEPRPGSEEEKVIRAVDKAQQDREEHLAGYTVTEHYSIRNSRFNDSAERTVLTAYVRGLGKTYKVLSQSGPSVLQVHVLDRIIKEEESMSRGEDRRLSLVTSTNYKMKLAGREVVNGRNCDILELTPRIKSPHLLKGKAWVDADSHSLVRIAGIPPASPSFLAGRPAVTRDYDDIEGVSLARKSKALSDSFLLGKTELTIDYTDYRITPPVHLP